MSGIGELFGTSLILALFCSIAVLLAGLWREHRAGQTAVWRRTALVVMVLALFVLILQPSAERSVAKGVAWVLTPGATQEQAQEAGLETPDSVLAVALAGAEPWSGASERSPDLATFLRHHPEVEHLRILGSGLEPWDLEGLHTTVSVEAMPGAPSGLATVAWHRQLRLGERLRVTGSVVGLEGASMSLELIGPDEGVTAIELRAGAKSERVAFGLEAIPPGEGRFLYRLQLRTANGSQQTLESIDVQVSDAALPAILWLEDAPNFETKFVKRWLIDQGGPLAIRSRISRDRYHYERHRIEAPEFGRLSWDLLDRFDLVIVEQRAWERLSRAEREILERAVREMGMGVLVRWQPASDESVGVEGPFGFEAERLGDLDRWSVYPAGLGEIEVSPVEIAPFELKAQPGANVLSLDAQTRILAISRPADRGTVGVTLLRGTYVWALEGHPEVQQAYWRRLIEALSRPDSRPEWQLRPGPILVNEPLDVGLLWDPDGGGYPVARIGSGNKAGARLAMRQDPSSPARWTARLWPSASGWHRLAVDGASVEFYVSPQDSWASWQENRRRLATRRAALRPRESAGEGEARVFFPIPRLPFYAVFLVSLGLLWLDERRGSR